uniref:hypothetical protein n=1 Tax=Hericium alpestre TaxID=135208 RepID=UPI00243552C2|nr:hypothetical protein QEO35_mgp15 [Hericium alpestre]WEX32018.1 hypothetical protein [Hericium alpestre]
MKIRIKNLLRYVSGGATIIAYQSWYNGDTNKIAIAKFYKEIENTKILIIDLTTSINNCINTDLRFKLLEQKNELQNLLNKQKELNETFIANAEDITEKNEEANKIFDQFSNQFSEAFNSAIKKAEELENSLNSSDITIKNFMDKNIIWEKINEFKDFVSTLSFTELCFVMNISMSIFIFTCLVSIICSFYGNFLIDKLSLDKIYPKLSSIIKLRVKLQHYYIITNTILIVLGLIL